MRYIDLELEAAMKEKFSRERVGHQLPPKAIAANLFSELLDCIHCINAIETQVPELPPEFEGMRINFKNMALALQRDHRR